MTRVLLTGATGFIGARVLRQLDKGRVAVLGRSKPTEFSGLFVKEQINSRSCFNNFPSGIDTVVHCAGVAHGVGLDTEIEDVNVLGTLKLASKAASIGVRRFIFISSVNVNGLSTSKGRAFNHYDLASPVDITGLTKRDAESGLRDIAKISGMEVVIIRPVLVYGFGVKANFASLVNLAKRNLPLPFGAIHNKRSFVAIDNLVNLIITCIDSPYAANQTFLVSDDYDVSTTELLEALTQAAGKKPRLLPIPMGLIQFVALSIGKKAIADRLCGSLQVDISHTKDTLRWKPPVSFEEGIARCFD